MKYALLLTSILFISCNKSPGSNDSSGINKKDSVTILREEVKKPVKGEVENDSIFEQVIIKFDNKNGVPHYYDERLYGYMIHGFEVDDKGLFYFFGGEPSTIVCFNKGLEIYRAVHPEISPSQVHFYRDTLYIFDNFHGRNNLFSIELGTGKFISRSERITENRVNNYHFQDSLLVLNMFDLDESVNIDSEMVPIAYDLNGLILEELPNLYGIRENYTRENDGEFMGTWKGLQIFWSLTGTNSDKHKFDLQDKKGNTVYTKVLNEENFGESLYGMEGNPQEHRKLRNEKIYILALKGDNAVITILPLEELFPEL